MPRPKLNQRELLIVLCIFGILGGAVVGSFWVRDHVTLTSHTVGVIKEARPRDGLTRRSRSDMVYLVSVKNEYGEFIVRDKLAWWLGILHVGDRVDVMHDPANILDGQITTLHWRRLYFLISGVLVAGIVLTYELKKESARRKKLTASS